MDTYKKLQDCLASIREKTDFCPKVALTLGSGLGAFAEKTEIHSIVDYSDLNGFPVSTVLGHKGRFVFCYVSGIPTVIMQGRVHYYEGYSMRDVVMPTRLMRMLGAEVLFLTNASGGINLNFSAGDFMLITGQISSFIPSPLIGPNIEELGVRFPDMTDIYAKELRETIKITASSLGIPLREGVYVQLAGPQFESPHEINMLRVLGGDAVGMSTACEAIAARHCGMEVCGISCVTNMGAGINKTLLTHAEVQEAADRVADKFEAIVSSSIGEIGRLKGFNN